MYPRDAFIRRDDNCGGEDYEVFPILHWSDADVKNYLKMVGLPVSGLYKKYGVSGCYWCPWYQPDIYRRILRHDPGLYDKFIVWEEMLNAPSVIDHTWLRDLKQEVLGDRKVFEFNSGL
jgi:3'-phosphoadenosine 5'-phosphosulfate sulfotransferase (PAPS reductase)/FAD synthetase